jgi:hypothetical protein
MHCLLEGLTQFHFREVLNLTTTSASDKPDVAPAFFYPFHFPDSREIASMSEKELKQILEIQVLLTLSINGGDTAVEESLLLLANKLQRSNLGPLSFIACSVGAVPVTGDKSNDHGISMRPGKITKI